jgi:hypothetical protein
MAKPTVAGLLEAFPELDREVAARLMAEMKRNMLPQEVESFMDMMDQLVDTHGVESISGKPTPKKLQWSRIHEFWGRYLETVSLAIYLNVGDPYVTTLLYDTVQRKFLLTTLADWIERAPAWYRLEI